MIATHPASIEDLSYSYAGSNAKALQGVTMELQQGLTAVAGASGSGKSTLLRLFNGLVPHFHGGRIAGRVRVGDRDALHTSTALLARDVGFVFQDPEAQFVRSMVDAEVAFSLENTGVAAADIGPRVEEALELAGAVSLRGRAVSTLSGGERQRVAIASAMALRPRMLVLDEPTSQLDPGGAATVLEACANLAQTGTAVVIAEHRVGKLLPLADRLAIITAGCAEGPRSAAEMIDLLADPPPLVAAGRALGWPRTVLTAEAARLVAPALHRRPPAARKPLGDIAWELRQCDLGHGNNTLLPSVSVAGVAGQTTVLMGPNGGGKTTLLRAIAGLHRPRAGVAWRRPGRTAYLPQDPGVLLHRPTVESEVRYTLARARSAARPLDILNRLGLAGIADRYPGDLSSGQRQRAALAAILAGEPGLVLLDEPTRGMDPAARGALVAVLRELAGAGTSVVLATHDSDLAADVADRVLTVQGGAVVDHPDPRSVLSGSGAFATDIGALYPGGPLTLEELLACR